MIGNISKNSNLICLNYYICQAIYLNLWSKMRRSLISYLILIERCRSLQPLQNAYDALELGLFLNMFSFFNSPEDVSSYGWLSHKLMKRLLYRVIHYGRDFSKTVCPRAWGKYTMRKSTSENPFITFSRL